MQEKLTIIKSNLKNGLYKNEAQVRVNLIYGLLSQLGWDTDNPAEVYAEYPTTKYEDNKKVDIALLSTDKKPIVFIEVKSPNLLKTENLELFEKQLRDYNRDNSARFSILTDGDRWRFYYSLTEGLFSDKCFKEFSITSDKSENLESEFKVLLEKRNVIDGETEKKAKEYLHADKKVKLMINLISNARELSLSNPYPRLPVALIVLCIKQGTLVTLEEAISFLDKRNLSKTLPEEELIEEKKDKTNDETIDDPIEGDYKDLDPTFSKITEGYFNGKQSNNWNTLLDEAVCQALNRGIAHSILSREAGVNILDKRNVQQGFRQIKDSKYYIQGVDARKASFALKQIAKKLNVKMYVKYYINKKQNAGKTGYIEYPDRSG
ncbi:MAG: type I restriction enzyme HsdR N-terminal domain-containing protein [Ignavibacteriaceae bacterium]|nr:type I restriction enzyme HsdR N-terminal domain-containing protein [Ignavibacteriaceae bacterium]